MQEKSNISNGKFRKSIKWSRNIILGLLTLSLILSALVQIPFIQIRLVTYATELATESIGLEVEIGSVELHPFHRTFSLKDLMCTTGGVELSCNNIDLKYKGENSKGVSEFGDINLDGVSFFASSIDQISEAFSTDSNGEHSKSKLFFERFELSDFNWQIGDSLSGNIELFVLDSILLEMGDDMEGVHTTMGEGGIAINIGRYEVRKAETELDGASLMFVEESYGAAKFANSELDLNVEVFKSLGVEFEGDIEMIIDSLIDESQHRIQLPDFDVDVIVNPNFIAPWVNDDVKALLGKLNADQLMGKILCKNGALIINDLSNSEISISGMGRKIGGEIVWDINLDIESSLLAPWSQEIIGQIQDKSPELSEMIDEIETINLSVRGKPQKN